MMINIFYYFSSICSDNNIIQTYNTQFEELNSDQEKFKKFIKEGILSTSDFFKLLSKNKQDVKIILDCFFQKSTENNIKLFWQYISDNFKYFCNFLSDNSYLQFYSDLLLSLHENNQDISLINIFNVEQNNKFVNLNKLTDKLINSGDHQKMNKFLLSISLNENVINFWTENLSKKIKDRLFDVFWKDQHIVGANTNEQSGGFFKVFIKYFDNKSQIESFTIMQEFFIFLQKNNYYDEFWTNFDFWADRYTGIFKNLRDITKDTKEKFKFILMTFSQSEDENLRNIFIDFIKNSKKSKYGKKILGLNKTDIEQIINTGYYNDSDKKLFLDYIK